MPITAEKAPSNLPQSAKEIYVSAFNAAFDGTCKDNSDKDACASKVAWSAVKKSYKKEGDKWVKKAELSHLDFYITKASIDSETGEKKWACVASDVQKDQLNDEMSKSLFDGFLQRIKNDVQVPPPWQSEYWKGGMPYLSLSHYSDGNGKNVPGEVVSVYTDGGALKSKGTFNDTKLGEASYSAVRESYIKTKSGDIEDGFKPVRISIGFLDYKHVHKSNGYVFERKSFNDSCPECRKEFVEELLGKERAGVVYEDGQLIHLALTREPVNQRTYIGLDEEVNKSMTTRKEDAASIVGEDLAEELENSDEENEEDAPEKSLVIKSKDESDSEVTRSHRYYTLSEGITSMERAEAAFTINDIFALLSDVIFNITFYGEDEFPTAEEVKSAVKTALDDASEMITARGLLVMKNLNVSGDGNSKSKEKEVETVETSPLDKAFSTLKEKYENVDKSEVKNLKDLQPEFDAIASVLRSGFDESKGTAETPEDEPADISAEVDKAVSEKINPILEEIKLLRAEMSEGKEKSPGEVRRGITSQPLVVVNDPKNHGEEKKEQRVSPFTQLANRTVGLPPNFSQRSEAKVQKESG